MNKGQVTILGLMLFTLVIMTAIIIIPFLKETIVDVRGASGLDCTATDLTTGTSMTCLVVDLILPYFIGAIIIAGGGIIAFRYGRTA